MRRYRYSRGTQPRCVDESNFVPTCVRTQDIDTQQMKLYVYSLRKHTRAHTHTSATYQKNFTNLHNYEVGEVLIIQLV